MSMTGGPSPWLGESLEAFMRKPAPPATLPETPQSVAVPPAVQSTAAARVTDVVTFNGEPVPPGELPAAVVEALKVVIK